MHLVGATDSAVASKAANKRDRRAGSEPRLHAEEGLEVRCLKTFRLFVDTIQQVLGASEQLDTGRHVLGGGQPYQRMGRRLHQRTGNGIEVVAFVDLQQAGAQPYVAPRPRRRAR